MIVKIIKSLAASFANVYGYVFKITFELDINFKLDLSHFSYEISDIKHVDNISIFNS